MGLRSYVIKRTIFCVVLLLFVITVNFVIFAVMPGSPIYRYAGAMKLRSQEQYDELMKIWGLDQPLWARYSKYVVNMLTWNFGRSYFGGKLVASEISARLANTLLLMGGSLILSIILGVTLGVLAAYKRGKIFDSASVVSSLITYSLPSFWMGMMFLLFFYYRLHWFPAGGTIPLEWAISVPDSILEQILTRLRHAFLPVVTLTLFSYGGYLLLTRAVMLEALSEDYVITARAKGLKERTVLFKHALKNASLPIITQAAMSFGFMLSGAILTETVFTWPGLGIMIWTAIINNNYPVMQAFFYIIALCVIMANFIADLLYGVIDPRIKYG